MKIGQLVKKIMYEGDLTQLDVANSIGCAQNTISCIRRGLQIPKTPLLFSIVKLAKKYKIEVKIEDLEL